MMKQVTLPDNTQHSQERDIHAPDGFQTRNPIKGWAVDPRLRPRGHWDQLSLVFPLHYIKYAFF